MANQKQNEKKKGFFDRKAVLSYGIKVVQELIGLGEEQNTGKVTLNDIKMDDVMKGKIRLEHKQTRILSELREVEKKKRDLFSEGAKNASAREKKVIAYKIKELDGRSINHDRMLQAIHVQMRIINNFIQIKEQEEMNKEMGLESIFGSIEIEELIMYMEDAMVNGELNMTRLQGLADGLDKHNMMSEVFSEDEDVLEIVRQMELASEKADSQEAIDELFTHREEKLQEKQQPTEDDNFETFENEF